MVQKRESWIDLVKVIAIFIVLLNHAEVYLPGVNFWGGMFYVAVFFVLSGYTYETKEQSFLGFVKNKAKRLLVPYFIANIVLVCLFTVKDLLMTGSLASTRFSGLFGWLYARNQLFLSGHDVNVYFYPCLNAPTWFLPALFLALILFDGLMRVLKKDQRKVGVVLLFLFLGQIIYRFFVPILLPWSLDAIPFFACLLQMGYLAKKYALFEKLLTKGENQLLKIAAALLSILFVILAIWNKSANLSIAEYGKFLFFALFNAAISSLMICFVCYVLEYKSSRGIPVFISKIGKHTLTILCYHLLIFMFLIGGMSIAIAMLGFSTNIYVMNVLKIVVIIFTMELFTRIGEQKRA